MIKALTTSLATIAMIGMLGSYSATAKENAGDSVMYGLIHTDERAHAMMGSELARLKGEGYTYFAVEEQPAEYAELCDYIVGRRKLADLSYEDQNRIKYAPHLINLIKKALDLDYTVIPFDVKRFDSKNGHQNKDREMFERLRSKLPPGAKVVIETGAWHINERDSLYPLDQQVHTPLVKYVNEFMEGRNHTILLYSDCLDEGTLSLLPHYVGEVDERKVISCGVTASDRK